MLHARAIRFGGTLCIVHCMALGRINSLKSFLCTGIANIIIALPITHLLFYTCIWILPNSSRARKKSSPTQKWFWCNFGSQVQLCRGQVSNTTNSSPPPARTSCRHARRWQRGRRTRPAPGWARACAHGTCLRPGPRSARWERPLWKSSQSSRVPAQTPSPRSAWQTRTSRRSPCAPPRWRDDRDRPRPASSSSSLAPPLRSPAHGTR